MAFSFWRLMIKPSKQGVTKARHTGTINEEAEMDNLQKIEQLVSKAGCSYEDAKAALEGCGWDMIDAIISLEREGKVKKETVEHTAQNEEAQAEIVAEVITEDRPDSDRQIDYSYEESTSSNPGSGNKSSGSYDNAEKAPKEKHRLWKRIKSILMNNRMVIIKSDGKQIVDLPIIVPIIALIAFFWATLILAVVAMVFGCRFHFEGEDLGKTNINSTMDKATDYAEKVRNDLTKKANE